MLARTPAFSVTVGLILTLGIGASTVVFSFFEAVLLKPLPVPRPEELVRVVQRLPRVGTFSSFPETYYDALRGATTLALAFGEAGQDERFALTAPAPAENVSLRGVTPTFFDALRAQPLRGRVLVAADQELGADTPPALLSHRLWRRRFGGNPDAIGTATLAVNGRSFVVVGVMPEGFNGIAADSGADLWIPLSAYRTLIPDADDGIRLDVAARLKPGVERAQAQAECLSLWQSRMSAYYRDVERRPEDEVAQMVARGVDVDALGRGVSILRDDVDGVLRIVIASTLLLLLIVCLNVGGILIARAAARQQELALRLALGASRLTLLRPLLAEGLLLAVLGAVGGMLLAVALIPFGREVLPPIRDRSGTLLPLTMAVGIDWRVGVFVGIITLLAMLSFTVAPAVFVARSHLDGILRSVRSTSAGSGHHMLMLFQVAVCTFLLLTAGLFVRTLQELRGVDTGFDVNQIATFTGDLGARADASAFLTTLRDRIREIPGVRSVSVSSVAVMRGRGVFWTVARTGERITRAHFLGAAGNIVSADYFDTMGMRIVGGRGFSVQENATIGKEAAIQAVVNQAFVAKFFGDVDAIGKRFGTPVNGVAGGRYEIVGVVNDAKYRSVREETPPTFYALGVPTDTFVMNVRASIRPDAVIEPVRKALASVDSSVPFREVHVMSDEVDSSMASERLIAILASCVGLCAALFVGAGIYGSLTYIATQRQLEIAVRLALGGGRVQTAAVVARRTIAMVVAGVIAGLAAALMAATGVRSMLFNVSPYDAPSAAFAVAFVAATATAAMALPLMRAIRAEPAEGLRLEQ